MPEGSTPKVRRFTVNLDQVSALHELSAMAMKGLILGGADVFVKDGQLVLVVSVDGRRRIQFANVFNLKHLVSVHVVFVQTKVNRSTGERFQKEKIVPLEVVQDLLAMGSWDFRILEGVSSHPIIDRHTGEVVDVSGYNESNRLFLDLDEAVQNIGVPRLPNADEVRQAVADIRELVADFPFFSNADQTAAIALFLTMILRSIISGSVPLAVLSAPSPGTGKTLLVTLFGIVVLGEEPPMVAETRDSDELVKSLVALLLTGPELIVFDNVAARFDSGVIAMALTTGRLQQRLLGSSQTVILKVGALFVVTGNNIQFSPDLARRSIPVRMVSQTERPWARDGFRHEDIRGYARENRARLLRAGLTLARAWISNGKGRPTGKPLGSFENWWLVIGGILENAGVQDFLSNTDTFYTVADTESATWGSFFTAWFAEHDTRLTRASDLVDHALRCDIIDEGKTTRATQTSLGRHLAKMADRTFAGLMLIRGPVLAGAQFWNLKPGGHMDLVDIAPPTYDSNPISKDNSGLQVSDVSDVPQSDQGRPSGLSEGNRSAMASDQGLF